MDTFRIIKRLSTASHTTMLDIAKRLGISPQGLYKALRGNISFNAMSDAIEECGYILLIGKMVDGKPVEVKTARYYEKD